MPVMTPDRIRRIKTNILGLSVFTGQIGKQSLVVSIHSAPPTTEKHDPNPWSIANGKWHLSPRNVHSFTKRSPRSPCSPKSPHSGDRFIPCRSATNFELSSHRLSPSREILGSPIPSRLKRISLFRDYHENRKVLNFSPSPKRKSEKDVKSPLRTPTFRKLPSGAEKVLDAPRIVNNFFLSAIDWSSENRIAVALDDEVYVHKVDTCETTSLPNFSTNLPYIVEVTVVKWNDKGTLLAVATSKGEVGVWTTDSKLVVKFSNHHEGYLTALTWRKNVIVSGDTIGFLCHQAVNLPKERLLVSAHSDIVCGLCWSKDLKYMASGSSAGEIILWEYPNVAQPYRKIHFHKSAVKAMRWCPWRNILATGGGVLDHYLCLWKTTDDVPFAKADTNSQVCDLVWSEAYQEVVTCHATPHFHIAFWKFPDLSYIAKILGHEDRVLSLTLSPSKTHLASASADETIRVWYCFPPLKANAQPRSPLHLFSMR